MTLPRSFSHRDDGFFLFERGKSFRFSSGRLLAGNMCSNFFLSYIKMGDTSPYRCTIKIRSELTITKT